MSTRTQTVVQLNERLLDLLDKRAAHQGVSRSHLIRKAIETYLAADVQRTLDQQIVEGYQRMPQGGEFDVDEWGDMGQDVTGLTNAQQRRLDQEEQAAGLPPW